MQLSSTSAMFYGISHLQWPTTDLERSVALWRDAIGLIEARRGEGYVDLDSGNVLLRLMQVPTIESAVSLRLSVQDVGKAYEALLAAGAAARYAPMRTPELEEMACVSDANGHAIVLWRALSEDEWGFVPELPKQGEWQPDAEELLKRLLAHVPALFRMLVRRKTTRVIEMMAAEAKSPVTRELVIRGYITSSAKATRFRLIAPLKAEGINPDDYKEDFDFEG
ncbi:DUF2621 family protein [Lampropedia cohaerens]|nr:DUF2621 family protein [Lampropedia cohaerens]